MIKRAYILLLRKLPDKHIVCMAATQKGHPGDINGSGKGETELRAHT